MSDPQTNRQFRLASRPVGAAKESDWDLVTEDVPSPADGEFVAEVIQISLDPAMRGWMNAGRSYVPPVEIGEVMRAFANGRVIASRHPDYKVGDMVTGLLGVQDYALSDGSGVHRIDPELPVPVSTNIGLLGLTGMTAYIGLLDIGEFRPGQTVVVNGAAGAVGSTVGQIAKILGGTVVGIAGGPDKCRYLTEELGFDGAVDYKNEDVAAALRTLIPEGADVLFDNVGGPTLDAGLRRLARGARVVICGAVSQYNSETGAVGPNQYLSLLVNRARMEGFVVDDHRHRFPTAARAISTWLAQGRMHNVEHIVHGDLLDFPKKLSSLFAGENTGKLVLDLSTPA